LNKDRIPLLRESALLAMGWAALPIKQINLLRARWCDSYEGRVIAFNHLSVTESPEDNARFFLEEAKRALPGGQFEFGQHRHVVPGVVDQKVCEDVEHIDHVVGITELRTIVRRRTRTCATPRGSCSTNLPVPALFGKSVHPARFFYFKK
jgi:hypothetical protein